MTTPYAIEAASLRAQRGVILALVVLAPLVFMPKALDSFGVPKASLVAVAALISVAIATFRIMRTGRLALAVEPPVIAALAFLALAAIATLTSDRLALSFVGHHGRFSGLAVYLSCVILFLATMRAFDLKTVRWVVVAVGVGGAGVGAYALMQWVGIDPVPWSGNIRGSSSTAGNPNFVAGHLAIVIPIAVWGTLDPQLKRWIRATSGVVAGICALALIPARSDQGWVAAGVGLVVLGCAWLMRRPRQQRNIGLATVGAASLIGALTVLAGALASAGPLGGYLGGQRSVIARKFDMQGAIAMGLDNPLSGVGFDRFGAWYAAYRPADAVTVYAIDRVAGAPHSVPVNMFASGGFPLALTYAAFIVAVGAALVIGLRRAPRDRVLFLGAVGGAWAAYQAQAAISIDIPSLVVTHWILAAAVLVSVEMRSLRTISLPWIAASERTSEPPSARDRTLSTSQRGFATVDLIVAVVIAIVTVLAIWPATQLLRADRAAAEAMRYERAKAHESAVEPAMKASALGWWEPTYSFRLGAIYLELGEYEDSRDALEEAIERDPRRLSSLMNRGRLAAAVGSDEEVIEWYERAIEVEPHHPDLKAEFARRLVDIGLHERAESLADEVLAFDPEHADALVIKAAAMFNRGEAESALEVALKALALRPGHEQAQRLIQTIRRAEASG